MATIRLTPPQRAAEERFIRLFQEPLGMKRERVPRAFRKDPLRYPYYKATEAIKRLCDLQHKDPDKIFNSGPWKTLMAHLDAHERRLKGDVWLKSRRITRALLPQVSQIPRGSQHRMAAGLVREYGDKLSVCRSKATAWSAGVQLRARGTGLTRVQMREVDKIRRGLAAAFHELAIFCRQIELQADAARGAKNGLQFFFSQQTRRVFSGLVPVLGPVANHVNRVANFMVVGGLLVGVAKKVFA